MKVKKRLSLLSLVFITTGVAHCSYAEQNTTNVELSNGNGNIQEKVIKETDDYIIVRQEKVDKPFFDNGYSKEGWWNYEKDLETKTIVKKKVKPVAKAIPAPQKQEKKTDPAVEQGPVVGSTKWLQQNLESYKELAIDNPTAANLKAYLYVQKLALDRAEQFARVGKMVVHGDPLLDATTRSPIGGSTAKIRFQYIDEEQKNLLKKLHKKIGLFYVFKDKCFLCDRQAETLQYAQKISDLTVKAVSLDEPTEYSKSAEIFPDYRVIPQLRQELKILALPATFMYNSETDEIKPLLQGMATLSDINSRFVEMAMKYNWISKEDYKYVKPFDDALSISHLVGIDSNFSKKLQSKAGKDPYGKNTNFVDPAVLVDMIQAEKYNEIPADYVPRGY